MPTRVLIAVGRQVWRDALRVAFSQWDVGIVAETGDGRDAVALAITHRPDVVVIESVMPGLNGPDATRMILAEVPSVAVIVVSPYADWDVVTRSMRAGASAYVLSDGGLDELRMALTEVENKRVYISAAAEAAVLSSLDRFGKDVTANILTPREREVLQLLSEGKPTKETADILKISAKTVETHRRHVMKKLGIYTVAGLTKFAIRTRLISLDD